MSGTRASGLKAAAKIKSRDKHFYERIGAIGGANGRGHAFAHGRVDPAEAGAKGGSRAGYSWSDERRARHSQLIKAYWVARKQREKQREQLFVADDKPFGEGFGRPSKMRQLIDRMSK